MLEIGSRYKTGYLFLFLFLSSYKLLCCWRHTRRILNTIESNSSNSFTPFFFFFFYLQLPSTDHIGCLITLSH